MKKNEIYRGEVFKFVAANRKGVTSRMVILHLADLDFHTEDQNIKVLFSRGQKQGWFSSVKEECECCGAWRTRYFLTEQGRLELNREYQ